MSKTASFDIIHRNAHGLEIARERFGPYREPFDDALISEAFRDFCEAAVFDIGDDIEIAEASS